MDVKKDETLIKGILNDDEKTIRNIYKMYYPKIKSMVFSFRNLSLEPDDVFQEGLVRSIMNIKAGKFKGNSSFYTYLFSICRNVCLKEINRNKHTPLPDNFERIEDEESLDFDLITQLLKVKNKLEENCSRIIDLRFAGSNEKNSPNKSHRFESIAEKLGISPDNARQRFKRCLDKLRQLLSKDPVFNELL